MSRQADAHNEARAAKRNKKLIRCLEYELDDAVGHAGCVLTGFSVKIEEWECLMTIRGVRGDDPLVSFVGSDSLINCILKAERDAMSDKLVWRADRYAGK